ncbi:tripartite tricarboxylate transporter substrate binding protein [Polaromonas sp. YR568]|uniref:Bug family tripartite tricarboxylate transporter substrate binding protein n=1 Tax=Polaromonas sp. YR568 TaxID=1855301 RepID=UPI0031378C11
MKRILTACLIGWTGLLVAPLVHAQSYPAKPVRLVVPFPAGGATDVLARTISQKASEKLGQQIVIDNRPGAGGTIGSDLVAKAAPDGYTLLIATGSTHSIGPVVNPKIPYNVERDFVPIVDVAKTTTVLVVPTQLLAKNLKEFIALLKANPGKFNYGSSGNGTNSHLSGELFKAQTGVFMTHIPYRGTGLVLTDMMSGQIQMLMDNYVTAQPHIRDGKIRVLGVSSLQRLPFMPDVPTLDEQGLKGFEVSNWFGIYAPQGTGAEVIAKVNTAFNQALQDPELQKRLGQLGATPTGGTPAQMAKVVSADTVKWSKLIKDRKLIVE